MRMNRPGPHPAGSIFALRWCPSRRSACLAAAARVPHRIMLLLYSARKPVVVSFTDTNPLTDVSSRDTIGRTVGSLAVIRGFKNKVTEAVFNGLCPKGFPVQIFSIARRKLEALEAAEQLDDLRVPPGNRLEALTRDRRGQHSIRINDQWRVCFRWTKEGPADVEIVDYH